MNFVRFLFIVEKIIILIIVVTFIPIAVYVYDARRIDVSPEMQTAYSTISQQVNSQGFLVALKNIPQCQPPSNMLFYSSCYDRCLRGSTCFLTPSNQSCLLSNNYLSNTSKICTSQPVVNQIDSSSATFWLNTSRTPLSQISIINGTLSLEYYCILNVSACEAALSFFGSSLEDVYNINYIKFHAVGVYLMNYGLIPLVIHIIVVLLLDLCFKFNLRLTNSLLVIHEGLIGIGLIVNGFTFNEQNDDIQTAFNSITQYCLIKDNSYCYSTLYQLFQSFNQTDNIASAFNMTMAFVLVLNVLCLIAIVVVNVLINKYYKMREIEPSSSGYELQTL